MVGCSQASSQTEGETDMNPVNVVVNALAAFYGLTNKQTFPDGSAVAWKVSDGSSFSAAVTYSPNGTTIISNVVTP